MRKKLIIAAFILLGLLGIASGAAVWWTSNYLRTPEFRAVLGRLAHTATGREARLDGELTVSFFPWFGLKAHGLRLGNDPAFGEQPLLTAREVGARIQVLPLLRRHLVFDHIELIDAEVVLTMDEQGRGNWEGMAEHLREQENASHEAGPMFSRFAVRGLRMTDSSIRLDDHSHNHSYITTDVDLRTGRIESGEELPFTASCDFTWPRPGLVARVESSGKLHWSAADPGPLLTETTVRADVGGTFMPKTSPKASLACDLSVEEAGRHLKLSNVRLHLIGAKGTGEVTFLDVTEMFRLEAKLRLEPFSPRGVVNAYWPGTIVHDHKGALHNAHGSLSITSDVHELVFETSGFVLDSSELSGRVRMGFDKGSELDFELAANRLDADALWSAFTSNATSPPLVVADLPLDYLRAVHGTGRINTGALTMAGVSGQAAQVEWQGGQGRHRFQLKPMRAQGGTFAADVTVQLGEAQRDPRPTAGSAGPVLGWSGSLTMDDVDARQVAWVNRAGGGLSGRMDLTFRGNAPGVATSPTTRLAHVVRRAVADVQASLGPCVLELAPVKGQPKAQPRRLRLSALKAQARLAPAPLAGADWALQLDGGVSATGVSPQLSLDARVAGLLRERQGKTVLSGGTASGRLKGWFLPSRENEAVFSGKGALDVSAGSLSLQSASLSACGLNLSGAASVAGLGGDWSLSGHVRCQDSDPRRVLAALDIDAPRTADKRVLQHLSGEADLRLSGEGMALTNLSAQLDDLPLRGSYSVQNFSAPRQSVNLSGGVLDLDRYLPPVPPPRRGAAPDPPTLDPLPVDTLRGLNLEGAVVLRGFKVLGISTRDLRATARASGGTLTVKPLSGSFYGGSISGEFSAQVTGPKTMQTRLALAAKDFQAGAFMRDWAGKQLVSGRTDLFLDVTGAGPTDHDLLRTLEGLGSFKITDGSYVLSGSGQGEAQDVAKTPAGATPQSTSARRAGSPFSVASAKVKVAQGVFQSEDFRMEAPNMVVTGKGRFSPAADTIQLTLAASMPGIPEVPIRVFGRLRDPEMEIPPGLLITNTIKGILGLPLKPIKFFKDLLF